MTQDRSQNASRRELLATLAALTAIALMPSEAGAQQPAAAAPRIIDTHHHFYPPEFLKTWMDWDDAHHAPHVPTVRDWTINRSLEEMDKNAVKTAILSVASVPGNWFDGTAATAIHMARLCNDYAAGAMRDHPGRYGLFAPLPMLDIDASLKEIAYAFDTVKADGVGLFTSYGDKWPGDALYKPVFEELNKRKALVYFHPLAPNCCTNLNYGAGASIIEYPHDTTRAVMSLLVNGRFAQYRDIRWLFSHGGGTVPMLVGRIDYFVKFMKSFKEFAPYGTKYELKRLYYDTANATDAGPMAALRQLVPDSQIVFGTDYPYVPTAPQLAALQQLGLGAPALAAIESGNIERLLPRLAT